MVELRKNDPGRAMHAQVALSMAFVCLIIGVPLWWKTTQVYRASLPYSEISALADELTTYYVHVKVVFFSHKIEQSVMAGVQENLVLALNQDKFESDLLSLEYKVFARYADEREQDALNKAKNVKDLDLLLWQAQGGKVAEEYVFYILPIDRHLDCGKGVIGSRAGTYLATEDFGTAVGVMVELVRQVFVREEVLERAYHLAAGTLLDQTDRDSMRQLRSEPAYDVTLTLLNSRPDLINVKWDVRKAVETYLKSFFTTMEPFVEFDVKSQVLYYVDLPIQPSYDNSSKEYYLKQDHLPLIINPIERELVSFTSNRPHINLVVYVTPPEHSPLYIRNQKGVRSDVNAFMSARWGGMMIYNLPHPSNSSSSPLQFSVEMKEVMEVLITQLRLLIGLENSIPRTLLKDVSRDERAVSYYELAYWLRKRSLENAGVATSALTSLSQLLATISNIVIKDDIGDEIRIAIDAVRRSRLALMGSRLIEAFKESKQALISAETAFFDQSLLELLYFPDDQKFAIYIPLFLPISLPVIISMLQAIKWLKQNRDEKEKVS